MEDEAIRELFRRCQGGDEAAAAELFALYARRLTRVAEQHLSRKLAGREDGEDVVQSVFRTFFRRCAEAQFRIDNANDLWRLLVSLTLRKAQTRGRHHTAEMRDVNAEVPDADAWLLRSLAEEPGPDEAAGLVDLVEALLAGLPPLYARLLEMRLEGHDAAEIGRSLGVSRQTVYRALANLGRRLERMDSELSEKT